MAWPGSVLPNPLWHSYMTSSSWAWHKLVSLLQAGFFLFSANFLLLIALFHYHLPTFGPIFYKHDFSSAQYWPLEVVTTQGSDKGAVLITSAVNVINFLSTTTFLWFGKKTTMPSFNSFLVDQSRASFFLISCFALFLIYVSIYFPPVLEMQKNRFSFFFFTPILMCRE